MSFHPRRRQLIVVTLAFGALIAATGATLPAAADEITIGYTPLRTSWDHAEAPLTRASVTQPSFHKMWSTTLPKTTIANPNQIYGQPLVADGKVIVVTDDNEVAALAPRSGRVLWHRSLGTPWTPNPACDDLVPHVGITATPVYSRATKSLYVVSKTATSKPTVASIQIHKISVTTGAERPGWPVAVRGKSTNGSVPFDATTANPRSGLLLLDGRVYFATTGHCGHGPFTGFVGSVETLGAPALRIWSSEARHPRGRGGIWHSGGGLLSDGSGRVFLTTGAGAVPTPAARPAGTLGESVVRLGVASDGTMRAKDFFSPANNAALADANVDLSSGGPVALPDSFGSAAHRHLLVTAGSDGTVRLLDRDHLGGMGQGRNGGNDVVGITGTSGVWGRAAVFDGGVGNRMFYLLPRDSPLEAFRVAPDGDANPTMSIAGSSAESYGFTSGSPIVTSSRANPANALVWVVTCDDDTGANGRLQAFPAIPPASGPWRPVKTFRLGTVAKYIQPATEGGQVFVGTRDGRVLAFGIRGTAPITTAATDFGEQSTGSSTTRTVTLTVNSTVRVTGVSVNASTPFSVGSPSPSLPARLTEGQTIRVPVTYAPSAPGRSYSTLTATGTPAGGSSTDYSFDLSATATAPGVTAEPTDLDFGQVAVGDRKRLGITVHNTGQRAENITGIINPNGDFRLVGNVPAAGYTLGPQRSVTVTVQFTPRTTAGQSTWCTVMTDARSNSSLIIPVTGHGFAASAS